MTLEPLLNSPLQIQIHVIAAIASVVIGPIALYRKRRDRLHKITGYLWVVAMLVVATTSWLISSFAIFGPFSPIHGFAIMTYWSIYQGLRYVFARRIVEHERTMRSLYWNGLLIAGLATFLPGRTMNKAFFGPADQLGWVVIVLGTLLLIARIVRTRQLNIAQPA